MSTRTDTLFPYTTLFRAVSPAALWRICRSLRPSRVCLAAHCDPGRAGVDWFILVMGEMPEQKAGVFMAEPEVSAPAALVAAIADLVSSLAWPAGVAAGVL